MVNANANYVYEKIMEEEARVKVEVAEVQAWWNSERFRLTKRPYTTRDVMSL